MKAGMFLAMKYDRLQLSLNEVCAEIGIAVQTARNQLSAGTFPIPTTKAGGQIVIDVRDLGQYIDDCRESAQRGKYADKTVSAVVSAGTAAGGSVDQYNNFISRLAEELAQHIRPQFSLDIDLWDTQTIAAYLKRSHSSVRDRIICLPDFPKAIRVPTSQTSRGHPLFEAKEVVAWARQYKEKR